MKRFGKSLGFVALFVATVALADGTPMLPAGPVTPHGVGPTAPTQPAVDAYGRPIQPPTQSKGLQEFLSAVNNCHLGQGAPKGPYSR